MGKTFKDQKSDNYSTSRPTKKERREIERLKEQAMQDPRANTQKKGY